MQCTSLEKLIQHDVAVRRFVIQAVHVDVFFLISLFFFEGQEISFCHKKAAMHAT